MLILAIENCLTCLKWFYFFNKNYDDIYDIDICNNISDVIYDDIHDFNIINYVIT